MNGDLSSTSSVGLASWYVPGRVDGFGDRLQMFDNTGTPSLELLRFNQELALAPGFEESLRERVRELKGFRHPSFTTVRAVQHLDGGDGLALVSVHEPGQRLSELFEQRPRKALHPGIVTWLLKELTPALVALHEQGPGVAHGALTADRIVLSPDGRLCIVEHVLGSALQQLRRSPARLWRDFGLVALPPGGGAADLDGRTDVLQLGGVALSMLLARPVSLIDVEHRLPTLLDEMSGSIAPGSAHQLVPLRQWLERALQLSAPVYKTAADALVDLKELPSHGTRGSVHAPGKVSASLPESSSPVQADEPAAAHVQGSPAMQDHDDGSGQPLTLDVDPFEDARNVFESERRPRPRPVAPPTPPDDVRVQPAISTIAPVPSRVPRPAPADQNSAPHDEHVSPAAAALAEAAALWPHQHAAHERPVITRAQSAPVPPPPRDPYRVRHAIRGLGPRAAVALCAIVLVQAAVIVLLVLRSPAAAPALGTVTIESVPGDTVLINGEPAGATPLQLRLNPDMRSLRIVSGAPVATTGREAEAPPSAARAARRDGTPGAVAPRTGSIRLVSGIDLTVLQRGEVLGSTSTGPIVLQPGQYQLELVNAAFGFRQVQPVTVTAGQERSVQVTLPMGTVSLNAQPWAQASIDGNSVGETPLANVPVAIGTHEVVFRHPELGERRETITVRTGATTRVSAAFDK